MITASSMIRLQQIAIIDLEASGFGSAGFPTEVGWAIFCGDNRVVSGSCLIRPVQSWLIYSNAWSSKSEELTGISRELLELEGLPPRQAMERFLQAVGERELFSDQPHFDAHWLSMLARAADSSIGTPQIKDLRALVAGAGVRPRSTAHRAEADARDLASAVLSTYSPH